MKKVWLNSYPQGVREFVSLDSYPKTLNEIFEQSVVEYQKKIAFSSLGVKLSFQNLESKVAAVAAYLQSLGLKKGSKVALMLPNLLQYPICLFAILKGGYTVVNLNPLDKAKSLKHQLKDSDAQALVVLENFAFEIEKIIHETSVKHVLITQVADCLGGFKRPLVNWVVRVIKKQVPKHKLLATSLRTA